MMHVRTADRMKSYSSTHGTNGLRAPISNRIRLMVTSGLKPRAMPSNHLVAGAIESVLPRPSSRRRWTHDRGCQQTPEVAQTCQDTTENADVDDSLGQFMRRPDKIAKIKKHLSAVIRNSCRKILPSRTAGKASMEPLWRSVSGSRSSGHHPVMFVGHDSHLAGSQMLLLEMLRMAKDSSRINPSLLLLGEGVLEPKYQKLANTCNIVPMLEAGMQPHDAIESAIRSAPSRPEVAICSTVACAGAAQVFRSLDIPVVHLINELPTTIKSNGWEELVVDIGSSVRRMVFVSRFSQQAFIDQFGLDESRCAIVHPGWLGNGQLQTDRDRLRNRIRKELSLRRMP